MDSDGDESLVVEGQPAASSATNGPGHLQRQGAQAGAHAGSRVSKRARSNRLSQRVAGHGPPQLVAIVGSTGPVRWASTSSLVEGSPLLQAVQEKRAAVGLGPAAPPTEGEPLHHLMGFIVAELWRFEVNNMQVPSPKSEKELLMASILQASRRCSGPVGAISYPVLAGASLGVRPEVLGIEIADMTSPLVSADFVEAVGDSLLLVRNAGDPFHDRESEALTFLELLLRWEQQFPGLRKRPIGWIVWHGVGAAMVRGAWRCDLVPVFKGQKTFDRLHPELPGRPAELLYLEQLEVRPASRENPDIDISESDIFSTTTARGSKAQCFHPVHITNAVGASSDLKQIGRLRASMTKHLRFAFPVNFKDIGEKLLEKGFRVPSRFVLQRARVRLDIVGMLLHQRVRPRDIVSRSLSYDASPQGGQELFACVETVVLPGPGGQAASSHRRSQPLSQLGHAHTGIIPKAMNLIHKAALDVGFDYGEIITFFAQVRVCCTDCGSEWSVADMPNVVMAYLDKAEGSISEHVSPEEVGFLMPNAIRIPGWSHSHDWILKRALTDLPKWEQYLDDARLLCWFLNTTAYKEVLARDARRIAEQTDPESLEWDPKTVSEFHANFAHWRFGTIARVSKKLHAAKDALRAGFVQEHFVCKEAKKLPQVAKLIHDDAFWTFNFVVHKLSAKSEDARQWGLGCVCHAAECRLAASRGVRYPCWRKGLSAAFLFPKTQALRAEWEAEANQVQTDDFDNDNACMLFQQGMRRMVAWLMLRFKFAEHIPWLLCAARDRSVARRCLQQYQQQRAAFDQRRPGACRPHRVSERFCGQSGSLLQNAFRSYIEDGVMTPLLSQELLAYEFGLVDESWAEGEHRNATFQRGRAKGSKFCWWAASCRLEANLALADASIERDGGATLCAMWHGWKSVLQPKRRIRMRLRPQRQSTQVFLQRVYRLGDIGLEDWLGVDGPVKNNPVPIAARGRHEASKQRIIKDWSQCVFRPGSMFVLPDAIEPQAAALQPVVPAAPQQQGPPMLLDGQGPHFELVAAASTTVHSCMAFEVLEAKPSTLKLAMDCCGALEAPIYVQRYRPLGLIEYDASQPPQTITLAVDGDACVVEGCILAAQAMRGTMVVYKDRQLSDTQGCIDVGGPSAFRDLLRLDDSPSSVPVYEMLRDLHRAGWKRGQRTAPHTRDDGILVFDMPLNCVSMKLYYVCLRRLQTLLDQGLPNLATRQLVAYYEACLRCPNKDAVLPGLSALEYKEMIRSTNAGGIPEWHALEDVQADHSDCDPDVELQLAIGDLGGSTDDGRRQQSVAECVPESVRGTTLPLGAGGDVLLSSDSDRSESGAGDASAPRSHRTSLAGSVPGIEQAAVAQPAPKRRRGDAGPFGCDALGLERPIFPDFILGVPIRLERVAPAGGRPPYQRLVVVCPLSHSEHADQRVCGTSRKLGGRCTERFGTVEAVGFLGAWIERARECPDRMSHMLHKPSPEEVETFLRRQQLLPA